MNVDIDLIKMEELGREQLIVALDYYKEGVTGSFSEACLICTR